MMKLLFITTAFLGAVIFACIHFDGSDYDNGFYTWNAYNDEFESNFESETLSDDTFWKLAKVGSYFVEACANSFNSIKTFDLKDSGTWIAKVLNSPLFNVLMLPINIIANGVNFIYKSINLFVKNPFPQYPDTSFGGGGGGYHGGR